MVKKKSLFLDEEVARVEQAYGKTRFLIAEGVAMKEVNYLEFMKFFKSLAYVFITSHNKQLAEDYREFNKYIEALQF